MLHRLDVEGILCITQPTHAWVSGCLARAWGNKQFSYFAPLEEVCLGAEQHDIGWLSWEMAPTLNPETGYPHNFREVPTAVHTSIWAGAKQLALPLGRYAALLVSLHGTGLYERYRSWEKSSDAQIVQEFLEQEYAFQARLIATLQDNPHYILHTTPEAIARNRSLVATWDGLSLALCHGLQHEQQIKNVPTAVGEIALLLSPMDNDPNQILISPWPFQQSELTLVYEGRLLREKFIDEEVMRAALVDAPWVTITNTLIPA